MPKELPGFYYDPQKNRYFPYKGPIPGTLATRPVASPSSELKQANNIRPCKEIRGNKLIQARELCGNVISSRKGRLSFQTEYQNNHASQPYIWMYRTTNKMGNIALEHVVVDVTSPNGQIKHDILLSGGLNGLLCLFQVGKAGQEIFSTQRYETSGVWPLDLDQVDRHKQLLRHIGGSHTALAFMPSDISCIKVSTKNHVQTDDTTPKHLFITTLGSHSAPGSVYRIDLSKPFDFDASIPISRDGVHAVATFKQTLWTADCDSQGVYAVIGTNKGATLVDMETGASSCVFRDKSDVLSLQFDVSGTVVLCGLRNGSIVSVDTREKRIKRKVHGSSTISMPSSVCCLEYLKLCDQYFLASSMDGSIKLYDHRMMQRGSVQSYEGNVNSHTRIALGVDPSERIVMSGGEDCRLRLWNIKSGELLFNNKFMNSVPSVVCWSRNGGISTSSQDHRSYWQQHSGGAWLGSYEGIFYMDWL